MILIHKFFRHRCRAWFSFTHLCYLCGSQPLFFNLQAGPLQDSVHFPSLNYLHLKVLTYVLQLVVHALSNCTIFIVVKDILMLWQGIIHFAFFYWWHSHVFSFWRGLMIIFEISNGFYQNISSLYKKSQLFYIMHRAWHLKFQIKARLFIMVFICTNSCTKYDYVGMVCINPVNMHVMIYYKHLKISQ